MRTLMTVLFVASIGVIGLANPALANIVVPSFVQMLTAPLAWVVFIVPVPVIFGIALMESIAARKHLDKTRSFWRLVWSLCIVNAVSSLLGLVAYPTGTEIWPGIPIAYALTVAAEAVLLFLFTKDFPGISRFRQALLISGRMNLASYAVLTPILVGLVYVPSALNESPEVAAAVEGTVLVHRFSELLELPLDSSRVHDSAKLKSIANLDAVKVKASDGKSVLFLHKQNIVRLHRSGNEWKTVRTPLPAGMESVNAILPNGLLLYCADGGDLTVVSAADGKTIHTIPGIGYGLTAGTLSSDNRYLAWCRSSECAYTDLSTGKTADLPGWSSVRFHPTEPVITGILNGEFAAMSIETGETRTLKIPGKLPRSVPVLSPDGNHIAYLGSLNQFTDQHWTPDLIVMDTQTGKRATIRHNVWTSGAPCSLFWVK